MPQVKEDTLTPLQLKLLDAIYDIERQAIEREDSIGGYNPEKNIIWVSANAIMDRVGGDRSTYRRRVLKQLSQVDDGYIFEHPGRYANGYYALSAAGRDAIKRSIKIGRMDYFVETVLHGVNWIGE